MLLLVIFPIGGLNFCQPLGWFATWWRFVVLEIEHVLKAKWNGVKTLQVRESVTLQISRLPSGYKKRVWPWLKHTLSKCSLTNEVSSIIISLGSIFWNCPWPLKATLGKANQLSVLLSSRWSWRDIYLVGVVLGNPRGCLGSYPLGSNRQLQAKRISMLNPLES